MAYADAIRSAIASMDDVADLIEAGQTWATWSPTYSANNSMTYTSVTTTSARYIQFGKLIIFQLQASGTVGGTPSTELRATLPATAAVTISPFAAQCVDGGATIGGCGYISGTTLIAVTRYDVASWSAGASRIIRCSGMYEAA